MSLTEEILSQLPGDVLAGLRQSDRILASTERKYRTYTNGS